MLIARIWKQISTTSNIRFLMMISILAKCLLYSVLKLYGETWFLSHSEITVKRVASYPKRRIYYSWRMLYRPITQQDDSPRIATSGLTHKRGQRVSSALYWPFSFVCMPFQRNEHLIAGSIVIPTIVFLTHSAAEKMNYALCSRLTTGSWHVNSNCNARAF